MKGILVLSHGSRRSETTAIVDSLIVKVRARAKDALVEPAYLQFCEPGLAAGISRLALRGATDIRVVPLFIFDGVHVMRDIPEELERARQAHPGVSIRLCGHIGDDDRLADIVVERAE